MAHITLAAQMIYLKEFGNIKKVLVLVLIHFLVAQLNWFGAKKLQLTMKH